ncbi:MAG: response regulator [Saprospiraceae bacterium]|nr:response regulator [Saprospiraceae bacterium]
MKKILIIEDHEDIRENLAEILELAGYEAFMAENGKLGVEIAERERPDLILCDVMMPVLDGYGTLSILHKKPATADIPFIFLTAKSEKTDFRYGMNLGADDYITKPFESNELLKVVEMRLAKSDKIKKATSTNNGSDFSLFINEAKGEEALKNLTIDRETRQFLKKSAVYTEGSIPRFLYYIEKGKVKISKTNDDGKELIISILGAKDFFGFMPILRGSAQTDNAIALEDCTIVTIPKDDFLHLLHANRDVSVNFIKMLAGNVIAQEEQLLHLAYNSVRKRVADTLILLHERYEKKPISMLREDIAALAGTAKETVIRTLTDFREEKLIDVEEGKITVLSVEKLKKLFN